MKKIIKITESELVDLCSLIIESVKGYNDSDIYEAFFYLFKKWLDKTVGDEYKRYPMSYLLNKYAKEFEKYYGYKRENEDEDSYYDEDEDYSYATWEIGEFMDYMIESGKFKFKGMFPEVKFTEKYAKKLPLILSQLKLPDYMTLEIIEEEPYNIELKFIIDFVKLITSEGEYEPLSLSDIKNRLKIYLNRFLGVEFGEPFHGKLNVGINTQPEYLGFENWKKNVFNKKIKKDLKAIAYPKDITRVTINVRNGYTEITISGLGLYIRSGLKEKFEEYFERNGYNMNRIRIYLG